MTLSRRSLFGFLAAAPVGVPLAVKAMPEAKAAPIRFPESLSFQADEFRIIGSTAGLWDHRKVEELIEANNAKLRTALPNLIRQINARGR